MTEQPVSGDEVKVSNSPIFSAQIPCATLHDVVTFLVEKTEGVLIPLILEEAYDKSICTSGTALLDCYGIAAHL